MKSSKQIRAVFLDLDGTLLRGIDTISARNLQAIQRIRERGVIPVITTGRPAGETDFVVRATGADQYLIVMNGLTVYENYRTRTVLREAALSEEAVEFLIPWLLEQNLFFEAYIGERAVCQHSVIERMDHCGMNDAQIRFFRNNMQVVDDLMHYIRAGHPVSKLFFSTADIQRIPQLRDTLSHLAGVQTLASSEHFVEILPVGMDKRDAVRLVRDLLGLTKDQIMVIGDSENDCGMFQEAGTCVAMGNAFPMLRQYATHIAPSNQEDGVAWALETLILGDQPANGRIDVLHHEEIEQALEDNTRQYFTGNLKMPQQLRFLYDTDVESGISSYTEYWWEMPHYHTITSEYCYLLSGETKYIDLGTQKEYHMKPGDFYILRRGVPYLQKCQPGCRLFFVKVPGINDKVTVEWNNAMQCWCENWDAVWKAESD